MICKLIKKFALYVFWNCLDESERQKSIKEHHYSKLKAEHVVEIEQYNEEIESNIFTIKEKLEFMKNKIENDADKNEILNSLNEIIKDVSYV